MTEKKVDLVKRTRQTRLINALSPVVGAAVGLLLGSVFIASQGVNPLSAYGYLIQGAFVGVDSWSNTLLNTVPLGLTGLAVALSYKAGVFNIGAEGQMYLGAIAATIVGTNFEGLPAFVHIPFVMILAALFGGIFALLPGYLKAYRGINEIVVTMLMNYAAIYFLSFLVQGPLREQRTFYPRSVRLFESATLPNFPGTYLHMGVFVLLIASVLLFLLFHRTTVGFNIEASGYNPRALDYAGINVKRLITGTMVASGAIAGIAGAVEIMGVHRRLIENFSVGLGYDAIAVALLANLHPLGVLLSAVFFGGLRAGANTMQIFTGIPVYFVYMVQAFVILFVVAFQSGPRILKMIKRRLKAHG